MLFLNPRNLHESTAERFPDAIWRDEYPRYDVRGGLAYSSLLLLAIDGTPIKVSSGFHYRKLQLPVYSAEYSPSDAVSPDHTVVITKTGHTPLLRLTLSEVVDHGWNGDAWEDGYEFIRGEHMIDFWEASQLLRARTKGAVALTAEQGSIVHRKIRQDQVERKSFAETRQDLVPLAEELQSTRAV